MTQATDGGPNPDYDPWEDAKDAIAEHLAEDDSAYADREEADAQAGRILEALKRRGLWIGLGNERL